MSRLLFFFKVTFFWVNLCVFDLSTVKIKHHNVSPDGIKNLKITKNMQPLVLKNQLHLD